MKSFLLHRKQHALANSTRGFSRPGKAAFSPQLEPLESRRLLSADVWTGAGGNTLFSNPANWQSGAAPSTGQDVDFPNLGSAQTVTIDATPEVGALSVEGDYQFNPRTDPDFNLFTADGAIALATGASANFSDYVQINQSGTATITVGDQASLQFASMTFSSNVQTLAQNGPGTFTVGAGNGDGEFDMQDGTFNVDGNDYLSPQIQDSATLNGSGTVAGLTSFGTVDLTNDGEPSVIDTAYNTRFYGGAVDFTINQSRPNPSSPGTVQSSEIIHQFNDFSFEDPTTLNLTLGPDYVHHPGDVVTLVHNESGEPINGTFSGLPEGTTIALDGYEFAISYVGGTTGHDITLTSLGQTPTVALTSNVSSVPYGQDIQLNAAVSGSAGMPTGTVRFYDNGSALATPIPLTNGTASITVGWLGTGAQSFTATYSGDSTYYPANSSSPLAATVTTTIPTIARPASAATATPLNHKQYLLSVLGADTSTQGQAGLTYTWSVLSKPAGSANPTFSAQATNAAQNSEVTFTHAGTYELQATATNLAGNSTTSDVNITVAPVPTSLRLTAGSSVRMGHSSPLTAVVLDQFGLPISTRKVAKFKLLSGKGTLKSGHFYAPHRRGKAKIQVQLDGLTATFDIAITA